VPLQRMSMLPQAVVRSARRPRLLQSPDSVSRPGPLTHRSVPSLPAPRACRKAAEQGHAVAQSYLGCICDNGIGVGHDATESISWYRKAAEQGLASAQYNLGVRFDDLRAARIDRRRVEPRPGLDGFRIAGRRPSVQSVIWGGAD
jgi:hypothetical protein